MQHLRTRAQFQALLARPPVARTAHFALHRLPSGLSDAAPAEGAELFAPPGSVWLGAMTPKRWARRAVTRNTIRRQIHAVGENLDVPLPAGAHLVRLRAAFSRSAFPSGTSLALRRAVRSELLSLFQRGGA